MQKNPLHGSIGRLVLAGVVAAGAAGLGPASAQTVKIGSLSAITGPLASVVPPIVDAEQLAVTEVNEAGGILGGRELELVVADSQCAAQAAVDAATKVINIDQVAAIVGALCSGATIAAASSVGVPSGVLMVSPTATSPELTTLEDNDFLFRSVPSDAYQGIVLANLVLSRGIGAVALTYVNNDYGVGLAEAFREAYTSGGGTITGDQVHEDNKASYRSELATLAAGDPQALVVLAYFGSSGLTIMKQSLENGFFEDFVGADGMRDDGLIEQLGADALTGHFFVTQPTAVPNPGKGVFDENFAAAGGDPESIFVRQAYDAAMLVALAIQKAGSTDRTAIRDALRDVANPPGEVVRPGEWARAVEFLAAGQDINYEGAGGPVDFDDAGDISGVFGEVVIEGNKFVEAGIIGLD